MKELEKELYNIVTEWQNKTFNHIQLRVFEKMTDNCLYEFIEPLTPDYDDILSNYSLHSEYKKWLKDNELEDNDEDITNENKKNFLEENYQEHIDSEQDDNYPMWNTLFELKEGDWSTLIEAAKEVNCGIITGADEFNDTIFMMSCGHSFYSSYWIPMYLKIFPAEAEKYKGVNYSHL